MKRFWTLVLFVFSLCILSACTNSQSEQENLGDYRPMIYVNDTLYAETSEVLSELPKGTDFIGTIEKTVSQSEAMVEENFCSNSIPVGSEIYYDSTNEDLLPYSVPAPFEKTKSPPIRRAFGAPLGQGKAGQLWCENSRFRNHQYSRRKSGENRTDLRKSPAAV